MSGPDATTLTWMNCGRPLGIHFWLGYYPRRLNLKNTAQQDVIEGRTHGFETSQLERNVCHDYGSRCNSSAFWPTCWSQSVGPACPSQPSTSVPSNTRAAGRAVGTEFGAARARIASSCGFNGSPSHGPRSAPAPRGRLIEATNGALARHWWTAGGVFTVIADAVGYLLHAVILAKSSHQGRVWFEPDATHL
jgi:hypothetical protein